MKIILWLSFVFFSLFGCKEASQQTETDQERVVTKDTLDIVRQLNEYKVLVDSVKSNLKNVQSNIYESAEGGTKKSFYSQTDTLKKELVYYGETGKRIINIYQKLGNPILIEDIDVRYEEPISTGKDVEIRNSVMDTYFLDDKQNLIYWLKNDQKMPKSQYKEQEKEIPIE